jgi:exopolysaccharide production protein ExoZ
LRLSSLQFLRAIAAWMVVFHHYNQVFFNWDMSNSILGAQFGYFFQYYGKLGVDIFFIISGFIMFYSLNKTLPSAKEFLIHRIIRVVPVYWFYTLIFLVFTILSIVETRSEFTTVSLFKSLFFIPHDNPSSQLGSFPFLTVGWTLNFEMFFYITLGCMIALFKNKAAFATFIILIVLPFLWGESWALGFSLIFTSSYLFEFAIGLFIGFVFCNGNCFPKNNHVVAIILLLVAILLMYINGPSEYKFLSVSLIVISILCIKDSIFESKLGCFLCHLGNISYSTYLAHVVVISFLVNYIGKNPSPVQEVFTLIIYVFGVYLFSTLSYKKLEVGKLNIYLRNSLYRYT